MSVESGRWAQAAWVTVHNHAEVRWMRRRMVALGIALVLAFSLGLAAWAGKVDLFELARGLRDVASAKLREVTVNSFLEGPHGSMTRAMAERVYEIMRKRPEERSAEEVAFAFSCLVWTAQFDRAEEFVQPSALGLMQAVRQNREQYPNKYYMLWGTVDLGRPAGSSNRDRAVAVFTDEYWVYPCERARQEKGITWAGERWVGRLQYDLVKRDGVWRLENPIAKGLGGTRLEKAQTWPPTQPWPPR